MAHSDDDGLVLPPKLAPIHVVIVPIFRSEPHRIEMRPGPPAWISELLMILPSAVILEGQVDKC